MFHFSTVLISQFKVSYMAERTYARKTFVTYLAKNKRENLRISQTKDNHSDPKQATQRKPLWNSIISSNYVYNLNIGLQMTMKCCAIWILDFDLVVLVVAAKQWRKKTCVLWSFQTHTFILTVYCFNSVAWSFLPCISSHISEQSRFGHITYYPLAVTKLCREIMLNSL